MSVLDRYIIRELFLLGVSALGVTTAVLFLNKLLWVTSAMSQYHLDATTVLRLLVYTLPTISGLTMPIAFLIGCTLLFNRLTTDNEYIAMQAAGISVYRLLPPILTVAVVAYGLTSVLLMYASPWGFQNIQRVLFKVARDQVTSYLQAGEFNETFTGLVLYVERMSHDTQRLEGLFIADSRAGVSGVITAREGELLLQADTLQVILRLRDGVIHRALQAAKRYHLLHFSHYEITLTLDTGWARRLDGQRRARTLFPNQLWDEIIHQRTLGNDTRILQLFWHKLFALPFACLIFAALGPAIGLTHSRSGRSAGYVLSLGGIFVYYGLLTASDALGEGTPLAPVIAAWLPNVCMGGLTLLLLRRTARNVPLFKGWRLPNWARQRVH